MRSFLVRPVLYALPFFVLHSAHAAYDPAIVAADARWVVYADMNGLRASTLGKELVTAIERAQGAVTGGAIGLDVAKVLATVGSLTAYGTNLSPDPAAIDGVLIAQGTADLRKIVESVLLQGTLVQPQVFTEVGDLPFPAYAISDPKGREGARTQVIIAFPPEPIFIVSKSLAQLLKARDVFRGAAPSLAKSATSPLNKLVANADGAYLFGASVVPTETIFPQNAPQTRILQLATTGALAFGERGSDTFARAELLATSEQNAEKLMKILQGMISMLSLAETNDKQLAEFLNSTGVTRDKNTVTLHLAYSSARLVQMAQALLVKETPRPANRGATISMGKVIEEWGGEGVATPGPDDAGASVSRTIENVTLVNGNVITVGRLLNGGRNARFTSVEILPADGAGAPLLFRSEYMRAAGGRGTMAQFQFPAADGTYKLRVTYIPDPDGKAKFAVSVSDPKSPPPEPPAPSRGPLIPQPKI